MLIIVDPQSGVPVYRQLMDQIKFHISCGLLSAGDQLPSTRTLSTQLGVNPMTISKAYSFLERERVIERRPGRPLVVSARDPGRAQSERMSRLRESLVRPVTVVRQLGVAHANALRLFEEMLAEKTEGSRGDTP